MAKAKKVKVEEPAIKVGKIVDKYYDVILRPLVTEKSMKLMQDQNKITVVVNSKSNKDEIKNAFEALFGVKVAAISTVNVRAKAKKVGKYEGQVGAYKKAIVKLAQGQSLDLFKQSA